MATGKFKFCDGSDVYDEYQKKYNYKKHKKGYIILGPPGIGKTTFVYNQKGKKDWIDADDILGSLGVKWHHNPGNMDDLSLNYLRADYMLEQSRLLGFRIIGAIFWKYVPDAIVIPPLNVHKKYVKSRPDLNMDCVIKIRQLLFSTAKKNKVKIFNSCQEAVNYLESL